MTEQRQVLQSRRETWNLIALYLLSQPRGKGSSYLLQSYRIENCKGKICSWKFCLWTFGAKPKCAVNFVRRDSPGFQPIGTGYKIQIFLKKHAGNHFHMTFKLIVNQVQCCFNLNVHTYLDYEFFCKNWVTT